MNKLNPILLSGAILGLLSVIMAAYVDHSLSLKLADKSLHGVLTALRYHQLYAIVISMIGVVIPCMTNARVKFWLAISAYIFLTGIIFFSFSIYFSVFFDIKSILYVTPIGGIVLMLGWISLIRSALA